MCVLRTSMCCTGLSLYARPKGTLLRASPSPRRESEESKLSQIKPSPSHHSFGVTFSKQTLELVRFFERLPRQDASLKNTASLKKLLPSWPLLLRVINRQICGFCFWARSALFFPLMMAVFWNKTVVFFWPARELALRREAGRILRLLEEHCHLSGVFTVFVFIWWIMNYLPSAWKLLQR